MKIWGTKICISDPTLNSGEDSPPPDSRPCIAPIIDVYDLLAKSTTNTEGVSYVSEVTVTVDSKNFRHVAG